MKNKLFVTALAALMLVAGALPAAAQDFRNGGDWRLRQQISVRQDGRLMTFDRGDRAFYRLLQRPFNFRPGLTYVYTNRCGRDQCMVLAFSRFSHGPVDRTWAPRLNRFIFAGDRDGHYDGRGDGRWIDRDHDGRLDGDRDYRGDLRDDRTLEGAPR